MTLETVVSCLSSSATTQQHHTRAISCLAIVACAYSLQLWGWDCFTLLWGCDVERQQQLECKGQHC